MTGLGELERLGPNGRDILVLGVDAPGFDELPPQKKILAYYLYRAAIAGNNIAYMQSHRHALEIKELLEAILEHRDVLPEELYGAVHEYAKYVWIHHGNYHHYSHTKFVPNRLTKEGLREAATIAFKNGARIELSSGETLAKKLARLERTIFDPDYEPVQTNQTEGEDIIATSAVNFWDPGITQADLEALPTALQHKLNVRFAKQKSGIVPQTYKIDGMYGRELEAVSYFLERALPYAENEVQRRSIELLLEYYKTGDEEKFRQHAIQWLKSNTTIDYLNGFIEQYMDPRGIIGSFEGNVSFAAESSVVSQIADNALYFERKMPWPDKYKRKDIGRPVANVVNVLVETADAGPISPAAYNLPNYNDIRRDHGSKNVILLNIENAQSQELLDAVTNEFFLPEYRANVLKYFNTIVRPLEVYMHEIIGHGSGQPDPKLDEDPRTLLGHVYSALEECRADLVALYHISDPKLVEIGAVPPKEHAAIVETAYISFTQGWITLYDRVENMTVREAHNKGSQMILMYLVEGGDAGKDFGLGVIEKDGDYFVELRDPKKVRTGLSELLRRMQVMKSTGDLERASSLFDCYGTRVNPDWHRNIVTRKNRLNIPKMKAFVFPHLKPVVEDGEVVDVTIAHDEDLTAQQLRFSRLQYVTSISAD